MQQHARDGDGGWRMVDGNVGEARGEVKLILVADGRLAGGQAGRQDGRRKGGIEP